jgi:translation initiation factor IF-1
MDEKKDPQKEDLLLATVTEALPNTTFRVKLEDDKEIIVYLSGKMRMHRIKVLVGDKVKIKVDDYGERGRIVQRL